VVLLYHRVCAEPEDHLGLRVSPEHFLAHLHELRAAVDVVASDDMDRRSARPRVVITFDDGYLDNGEVAAPLLERFELPATMFVTTGGEGHGVEYWWDRLWHLFVEDGSPGGSVTVDVAGAPLRLQLEGAHGGRRAYRALNRRLMRLPPEEVHTVLAQLEEHLGRPPGRCPAHARLAADDLRRLDAGGLVRIGAHTRTHACLSALSAADAEGEIRGSRDDLTAMLGRPPTAFAYPYGASGTFGRDHVRIAREAGFSRAFVNVPARTHTWGNAFRTPRFIVGDWDGARFRAQLARWLRGHA